MILYHGSNLVVDKPRIIIPNRYLDFGTGFYTTSNILQAENFANKVAVRKKEGNPVVSIYEINEESFNELNVLAFDSPDEKWLDFVSDNRNGIIRSTQYDMIYGPVADDDIFRTFILYNSGVLTKEQTLEALKIKKLFNQYVFCTDIALSFLKYKGCRCGGDSDE